MKFLLTATLLLAGIPMLSQAQTATPKKPTVFACNMKAMTPAQRKRQTEVLTPGLQSSKTTVAEVADGYEFTFPSDRKSFEMVSEWVSNERLCCDFFNFDIKLEGDGGPLKLRITGDEGVKQFIQAELSTLVKG